MSSPQFGNTPQYDFAQPSPSAPPPARWDVPPGPPGYNLSPNPQMWMAPTAQQWNPPAQQWNPPAPQQWNNSTTTVIPQVNQSTMFHQFLKGRPKTLGVSVGGRKDCFCVLHTRAPKRCKVDLNVFA